MTEGDKPVMYEVKSIIRPERVAAVVHALHEIPEMSGLTVSVVRGFGRRISAEAGAAQEYGESEMAKVETVVPEGLLQRVVDSLKAVASTGRAGDGNVFVSEVRDAIKLRSGLHGSGAL